MEKQKILIAENDYEILEKIKSDPDFSKVKVDFAEEGSEAQALMKTNRGEYIGIFISPKVSHPSGLSCVRFAHMYHPSVPIFLFDNIKEPIDEGIDENELGVTGIVAAPYLFKDLLRRLSGAISFFDEKDALGISALHDDKLDQELDITDGAFCAIKAQSFISGNKTLFDTYVKLRKDKFIKIIQAGDQFEYSRLLTYLKKGVEYFYIRNEAREQYLTFCDKISEVLVKKKEIPINKKFPHLFNQCDVTIKTLSSFGVSNENISHAQRYITRLCGAIDELKKDKSFIGDLLRDLEFSEHSSGVVMIAAMVAKEMGIETNKSLNILGVAAMFHDIGFVYDGEGNKRNTKYKNEATVEDRLRSNKAFGEEKKMLTKILAEHSDDGYYFLTNIAKLPPVTCQIVKGHHAQEQKARGTYKGGVIHPMSEILEVADKFERILASFKGKDVDNKYIADSINRLLNIFPKRIRDPFLKVFNFEE